jgi:hypothetical protein
VEGAVEAISKRGRCSWVEVLVVVEGGRHRWVAVQRGMNESLYSSAMEDLMWRSMADGTVCRMVNVAPLRIPAICDRDHGDHVTLGSVQGPPQVATSPCAIHDATPATSLGASEQRHTRH